MVFRLNIYDEIIETVKEQNNSQIEKQYFHMTKRNQNVFLHIEYLPFFRQIFFDVNIFSLLRFLNNKERKQFLKAYGQKGNDKDNWLNVFSVMFKNAIHEEESLVSISNGGNMQITYRAHHKEFKQNDAYQLFERFKEIVTHSILIKISDEMDAIEYQNQ